MSDSEKPHKVRSDGYHRWFPGDHLRDTMHLSLTEEGAYRRLLDFYYSNEGLTSDRERLYQICRTSSPDGKKAVDFVVGAFFLADEDHLINSRADREIVARRAYRAEQARKSKLGTAARWGR